MSKTSVTFTLTIAAPSAGIGPSDIVQGGTLDIRDFAASPNKVYTLVSGSAPGISFSNGVFTAAVDATLGAAGNFTVNVTDKTPVTRTLPSGVITLGTPTTEYNVGGSGYTTLTLPFTYSKADQTGFVYRLVGWNSLGSTSSADNASPLVLNGLKPQSNYTIQMAPANWAGLDTGGVGTFTDIISFTTA